MPRPPIPAKATKTLTRDGVTFVNEDHIRFIEDMEAVGHRIEFYQGRFYWKGPAVRTDVDGGVSLQAIHRATEVKLQHDSLGKYDSIVYPVRSDSTLEQED